MSDLERITGIRPFKARPKEQLGTLISAEMYNKNKTQNSVSSCFSIDVTPQQSTRPEGSNNVAVLEPQAATLSSSATPSGVYTKEKDIGSTPRKNIPRKIKTTDNYVHINMGVNEIRRGTRTDRMNAYMSLRDENDKKFSIYLRSSLTTSIDETYRSVRKDSNIALESALDRLVEACPNDAKLFTGRIRYNPRRFKIEIDHKYNLKLAILGIYDYGTHMTAILYMFDEPYIIELSNDLTTKQQGIFDFVGSWQADIREEE